MEPSLGKGAVAPNKFGGSSSGDDDDSTDVPREIRCQWPNMPLDPDTFGLTICCMARDFTLLAQRRGSWINRYSRVVTTISLLAMCIGMQVLLLRYVKAFVSARAVHDVRNVYDSFQDAAYHGNTWILAEWPTVERRGLDGPEGPHFDASVFPNLDHDLQEAICNIPLSQPVFFFTILYVWTLTCVAEIRKCKDLFESLILQTERCDDMSRCLVDDDVTDGVESFVIARLSLAMKVALTILVLVPRLLITCYLLWVGCRWLLATTDFSDLILNAVALEFILNLKDMLYLAIVPRRSMIDLENTAVRPTQPHEPESLSVLIGTMSWAFMAAFWVLMYIGFPGLHGMQTVLRDFQWDVHHVCTEWIATRFSV